MAVAVVVVVAVVEDTHHHQVEDLPQYLCLQQNGSSGELGELLQQRGFDSDGRFQGMHCGDVDGVMEDLGLLLELL